MNISALPEQTTDEIFATNDQYRKDPQASKKVNLVVGVYCDENGSSSNRLSSVTSAMSYDPGTPNYSPIAGEARFRELAGITLLGPGLFHTLATRIAQAQTAGGTGALSLAAELLQKTNPKSKVFVSDPTWGNHHAIFEQAGFQVDTYPYYSNASHAVDVTQMSEKLSSLDSGSIVLLHACCHNPTGIDMTMDEWNEVIKIIQEKKLIPILDSAYQGFGDGLEEDARVVRKFASASIPTLVAQSFSKMFHIYNSRTGMLHVLCNNPDEKTKVQGTLENITRATISNPPAEGSRIITKILSENKLRTEWEKELQGMRERIQHMRQKLVTGLGNDFQYLESQKGMFSFTGLSPEEVMMLKRDYAIYMLASGRMSIPGLNEGNIEYVTASIRSVLEKTRAS